MVCSCFSGGLIRDADNMMCKDRDWIKATIAHEQTEAVPYNATFCPPVISALQEHFGTDDIKEALGFPIRTLWCIGARPLYASPAEYGERTTDEFGVLWANSDIDRGTPVGPPLTEANLSGYTFPDPAAEDRFENLGRWCRDNKEHFTIIWVGDLWERATFMRGMENILLDVALNRRFVEELLRGIADYILATMEILFERFAFDGIALSDDYGSQKAMLISPDHWRGLIKPLLAEIYGLAKKHDRYTFHHSCGNITPIIPDMIEVGIDILNPIQPEAMDIYQIKRDFGADLTLCGGLRTQDLLPSGTPQQIRDEVRKLKSEMGAGGGYILEPGITIQADVPLENTLALFEEARKTG